eukprot:TRINITY_DN5670_c0_g1_i1.p1 TRINITY_DN5670_c0_g1~~TRINITY_DN5670_c0_g1_i1.p1  ORF type:complete len:328 (+),score=8.86 TRINITY_DN5670_c0_g1_i1:74-985(+)
MNTSQVLFLVALMFSGYNCGKSHPGPVLPFMNWGNNAYYISTIPLDFRTADKICKAVESSLVVISYPQESMYLARRLSGADYDDENDDIVGIYQGLEWKPMGKVSFWIGNMITPADKVAEFKSLSLSSFDDPSAPAPATLSRTTYTHIEVSMESQDGEWKSDVPKESPLHFICSHPLANHTSQVPFPSNVILFYMHTVQCSVAPMNLEISYVYQTDYNLLAFVYQPYQCLTTGYTTTTAVTSLEIIAKPLPIKYYIIDENLIPSNQMDNAFVKYVRSIEEILILQRNVIEVYPSSIYDPVSRD